LTYQFFRSVEAAGRQWDAAAPTDNIFLQRPFLSALEQAPPEGMRFGYLIFFKHEQPVGVSLCQIKFFKADENIQELNQRTVKDDPCFFNTLADWFKKRIAGWAAADILISGNMLLTGQHSFHYNPDLTHPAEFMGVLEQALLEVQRNMEQKGVKMPVTLLKDLRPRFRSCCGVSLASKGFTEFEIQPNMVLDLHWDNFDQYLGAQSTRYRTNAKRAFKKAQLIEKRTLSLDDLHLHRDTMYSLYQAIAKNAGFNMVDLNQHYLISLKQHLPDNFSVFGYFLDNRLIAFYSTIHNGHELEAHFLGYEKSLNHDYQLYLNMLYDIVRVGFIAPNCQRIVFSRTALEIKSSIGAVPEALFCYLRHHNPLLNRFTGTLLDYLKPTEIWQQRHPFKQETVNPPPLAVSAGE
jgi:hypothetical protein